MANKKDKYGISLRKYGHLIRDMWPLNKGWRIGATPRSVNQDTTLPIHQWDLKWTVTKGARKKGDVGGESKGRTITLKGEFCGPGEVTASFSTVHEAYCLYYKVSGAKLGAKGMPPKSNPTVSMLDPQWEMPAAEFAQIVNDVVENAEESSPSIIDVLGEKRPVKPSRQEPERRRVSAEVSPLENRARELLHAYMLMGSDLEALKQEMTAFSIVFNSTQELRSTKEAKLLTLAVADKLTARQLKETLDTPKRDTLSFKSESGDGVSIVLTGAFFRCTSCDLIKSGSAFGMRKMTNGEFRNQAQCGECRRVHDHSRLSVVADQTKLG
jgi:hypothetical protein